MNKILADENIHILIIDKLINNGYDVVTVVNKNLSGAEDKIILEYANKEDGILITMDKDFGGILEFGSLFGKGRIILIRYRIINIKQITNDIIYVLNKLKNECKKNKGLIVVLSEGRYRIHKPASK